MALQVIGKKIIVMTMMVLLFTLMAVCTGCGKKTDISEEGAVDLISGSSDDNKGMEEILLNDAGSDKAMQERELSLEETRQGYERFTRFDNELSANGLALPEYLYHPVKQYTGSEYDYDNGYEYEYADNMESVREGAASQDIMEMEEGIVSDRVKIVLQTGGSRSSIPIS